jgi:hypothetical protein
MKIFRRASFALLAFFVVWFPVTELCNWAFTETAILLFAIPALLVWLAVFLKDEPVLARIGLIILFLIYGFSVMIAAQGTMRS